MDALLDRCAEIKGQLVKFALSDRFGDALAELIWDQFPDGVIDNETTFQMIVDGFIHSHRLAGGTSLLESFADNHPELSVSDRAIVSGWRDCVQGTFEISEMVGADGFTAFNHIDELTYRVRSNMGPEGVAALSAGMLVIGRIDPVTDFWMISGPMLPVAPEHADTVLARIPQQQARYPEAVFRNPEKLAQGRKLQAEQRADFLAVHGGDTIVVPGSGVRAAFMAVYRRTYERLGSVDGPWTEPDIALPDWWSEAETVGLIYDEIDGLGCYADYALLIELFDDPKLFSRRRYRETLSDYLREESVSPVPLVRLAEANPDNASRVFAKLLKKPRFSWVPDGDAVLRRYKRDWYENPPLPRIVVTGSRISRACDAGLR